MTVAPQDDFPHPVAPQAWMTWKENWVFCALDTARRTAAVFHVSLRPVEGEGIFTAKLAGPGLDHRHVGRARIPADPTQLRELADDRLAVDVVDPARELRIRYRSDELEADLRFTGRFPPFDFADGPKAPGTSTLGEIGLSVFPFHHYEQGMAVEGEIAVQGEPARPFSGWGNRDHSWGFRDDFQFHHHHWVCASFEDCYVQGSAMLERSYPDVKNGGFVSGAAGNDPVRAVDTSGAYWLEPGVPLPALDRDVRYRLTTVGGRTLSVVAHVSAPHATLYLNARSADRGRVYQDRQVFCDFTLEETGQRGGGLLEVGKYLEGPGIADRIRSRPPAGAR